MDPRWIQLKLTIKLAKEHSWKLFKVHTILPGLLCSCGAYNCTSPGKHPVYKDWKNGPFLDEIEQFVIRIGEINYLSNVGIKTGDGLAIIDFDSKESYITFFNNYVHLKNTLTVETGKGYHAYFNSKEKISNKVKFLKDTDLRGDGGFVVAPGSNHFTGKEYVWKI